MVVVKGSVQCACYELMDQERSFWIEVDPPSGKKENILVHPSKVDFFLDSRAISG